MNDLKKLRALLLTEEHESLEKLKIQIEQLSKETNSSELLVDKISPLISSILQKSYTNDEKLLLEVLSPIVLELIDKNYTESQDKVVKQIAPLITNAIKEQIKSHKDEVVDALYPVLGNMISKYVSKTFEDMLLSINNQIKNGLIFKTLKRKIKAKIQGISETELLLKENAFTNIKSVFFIHKETGTVLSHAQSQENEVTEPEMIASMLTAIRSFINDWVDKNEKYQEINTIEYGASKIILEASGYSYLAVIVDGSVSQNVINNIHEVLSTLVSKYSKEIKDFNGNMKSIPSDEFHNIISKLINTKNEEFSKKIHPIIYIVPLVFISYLIYTIYTNIIDKNLENQANEILYKTPTLTLYRLDASVENKELSLNGVVPFESYKLLAYEKIKDIKNIKNIKNTIQVINTLDNPKEIKDKITYLLMLLNSKDENKIEYSYEYPNLYINGTVFNNKNKAFVIEQFKRIEGLKEVKFNIEVVPSKIDEIIYFQQNSAEISQDQEYKLISIINTLKNLDDDLILEVKGFRDPTGTNERNTILVKQRAENIMKYLKLKGNVSQKIINEGINEIPSNIDFENYPEQARRVIFTWKK